MQPHSSCLPRSALPLHDFLLPTRRVVSPPNVFYTNGEPEDLDLIQPALDHMEAELASNASAGWWKRISGFYGKKLDGEYAKGSLNEPLPTFTEKDGVELIALLDMIVVGSDINYRSDVTFKWVWGLNWDGRGIMGQTDPEESPWKCCISINMERCGSSFECFETILHELVHLYIGFRLNQRGLRQEFSEDGIGSTGHGYVFQRLAHKVEEVMNKKLDRRWYKWKIDIGKLGGMMEEYGTSGLVPSETYMASLLSPVGQKYMKEYMAESEGKAKTS